MKPRVSIIVPCYNEQKTICDLLDALLLQTFPRDQMEVVIADGLSRDQTLASIASFQRTHPDLNLRLVENAQRTIPSALNLAIRVSRGDILIRLDAHSVPIPEYVERCVADLEAEKGANVGGVWEIRPGGTGWIAEGIAAAAAHPLGVGDARYRLASQAGPVDTVPFGAFRRALIDQIGGFDETLLTNEDYEFNTRIRKSGGKVWLDPRIRSIYFARAALGELAGQYWRYGFWKLVMLRRYPDTIRWRQALPPLFVLSLLFLVILSIIWNGFMLVLLLEIVLYFLVLAIAAVGSAIRRQKVGLVPGLILAIPTMHVSWGCGFLWSLANLPFSRRHG